MHARPDISSRLPQVGTTIFTVMSSLAAQEQAVNLGQGFPDFPMPEELHEAVTRAMREGWNQYAHMAGHLPLRERIAEKVHFLYGASVSPETEITITPGGTYALYTALTTILNPGDEVIVFEPAYDSYIPNIEINGAKAIRIPLRVPDYSIPWEQVRGRIHEKTRAILLNSPHNPSGAVLREEDILSLRRLVHDFPRLFIVSDEVYEHLVFDGLAHQSMLRHPDLRERSFACFSFGKVYHCTGWKLGYCIAPADYMKEFRKVHQFNAFSCHTPMQVALAEFLQKKDAYLQLGAELQTRRDYFRDAMRASRFQLLPSYGSYFICGRYGTISDESDLEFARRLTSEYKVATIPLSAFYRDGDDHRILRFCFAKKRETLDLAIERLLRVS